MSREALQESLSAVMDNEADELELAACACSLRRGRRIAGHLVPLPLARAVMHREPAMPKLDIAAAVSAALADEAAPRRAQAAIRGATSAAWPSPPR
ncbi:RseA family anti-sigma factor [Pseudomonas denitrificans (nom. rej.)]|uniref:RseA family anti-sigma factor n=1 Tax=Pseudomonas denitrificans TaxID=43306 RepID=UPI001E642945|nr:RseA family anti-sigma factor [Pseudomonas denitrificans (nom. rej.)]